MFEKLVGAHGGNPAAFETELKPVDAIKVGTANGNCWGGLVTNCFIKPNGS